MLGSIAENTQFVDLRYPSLRGKIILITGASSGIGNKTARILLKSQASIYCLTRRPQSFQQLYQYSSNKGSLRVLTCNLENPNQIKSVFYQIMQQTRGTLHGIINCAGHTQSKQFRDTTLFQWDNMLNVNFRAPMQLMSMAVPYMKETGGSVVNVSASPVPRPKQTLFCVSKTCLDSLTECSALELAGMGIRVNGVAPGYTRTELRFNSDQGHNRGREEKLMRKAAQEIPLMKINDPGDVAHAIAWLVSDQSSFVNGQILTIDGGASVQTATSLLGWHYEEEIEPEKQDGLLSGIKKAFNFF